MEKFTRIETSDMVGHRISELPDTPDLTPSELKRKFDDLAENVIARKFNDLVEEANNIDVEMSDESENYVSNNVIKAYVDEAVKSGGITVDEHMSSLSPNPVQNKVITNELDNIKSTQNSQGASLAELNRDLVGVKNKLDDIDDGAERNTIVSITVNGTAVLPDSDRNVNINTSGGGGGGGTDNYNALNNLPSINGITLKGNKTTSDLGIDGTKNYNDLSNKPTINGVALSGNKTTADLGIAIPEVTASITETVPGKALDATVASDIYDNISSVSDLATSAGTKASTVNLTVNSEGKLVFTNAEGADSVIPFSASPEYSSSASGVIAKGTTKTAEVAGNTCIVAVGLNFTDASNNRMATFLIEGNTVTELQKGTGSIAQVTRSGNTISIKNTNTASSISYSVIDTE